MTDYRRTWIEIVFDILQYCQYEKPLSLSVIFRYVGISWNQSMKVMKTIEKNKLGIIYHSKSEKYNTPSKTLVITDKGREFIKKFIELKEYIKQ